ncbi:MAG: LamG-like jellyroll fold domain-containing protein [Phycisphaerales bacterium]
MIKSLLAASVTACLAAGTADAATLLSHFTFDNDLTTNQVAGRDALGAVGASLDNSESAVGGGSVLFDGGSTAEYVVAGTNAVPNDQEAFYSATVALWFKAGQGLTVGSRALMGATNGNPATFGADDRTAFLLETDGSGKLRVFIRAHDGSETNNRLRFGHLSSDPLEYLEWADGDWHHLAYSWDIDSTGLLGVNMWLDGVPLPTSVQENTLENDPIKNLPKPWEHPGIFIGAQNNRSGQGGGPSGNVNGWIDDLRVYEGVLSDGEVAALAALPEPASLALLSLGGVALLGRRRS